MEKLSVATLWAKLLTITTILEIKKIKYYHKVNMHFEPGFLALFIDVLRYYKSYIRYYKSYMVG